MRTKQASGYKIKIDERVYRALKIAEVHNLGFTIELRWVDRDLVIILRCERSVPTEKTIRHLATLDNWRSLL